MPSYDTYPRSATLHFPSEVYQKIDAFELLPQLLEIVEPEDLKCVQFLRGGKVCLSFKEKSVRAQYISEGLRFNGQDIPVTRDAEKLTIVYLHDLRYEIAGDDVYDFFSSYGDVLTVERSVSTAFPSLCDGNRVIKIVLEQSLPSVVVNVVYGIVNSLRSVSCIVKLAIVPSPALSLVCFAAAGSRVIWPVSVRGLGIQLLLLLVTLILWLSLFRILLTQKLIL